MNLEDYDLNSQSLTFFEAEETDMIGADTQGSEYEFYDFTLPTLSVEPISKVNSLFSTVCYCTIYDIILNGELFKILNLERNVLVLLF